jgi:outer membrane protein assembly factor BamB
MSLADAWRTGVDFGRHGVDLDWLVLSTCSEIDVDLQLARDKHRKLEARATVATDGGQRDMFQSVLVRLPMPVVAVLTALAMCSPSATGEDLDVKTVLEEAGSQGGIVVQLGCEDVQQCLAMHADGRCVVQSLDRDADKVEAFRRAIQARGCYGQISARIFEGNRLPYVDNLINLLVVHDAFGIPEPELMRVVRPLGTAVIWDREGWKTIVKPWPAEIDQWTHFLHGPTGNAVSQDKRVGPPRRLQWSAGPMLGRSHEMNNSFPALVTARGRMFYVFDDGLTGMEDPRLGERWKLIARDAFNGSLLWERPLPTWGSQAWQTRALRFFGGDMARRLVADGDRLYVTFEFGGGVHVLDAATGKTLGEIPGTTGAREILVDGGHLFVAGQAQSERRGGTARLVCYDLASEKTLWVGEDKAILSQVLCVGPREAVYHNRQAVVCLNRNDGTVRWSFEDPLGSGRDGRMLLLAGDKAAVSSRERVFALAMPTGELVWQAPGPKGDSMLATDLFCAQGAVWCSGPDGTVVGYDLRDGAPARQLDVKCVQSHGHHLRCYRAKATEDFLITQFRGVEFLSLDNQRHTNQDWLRGTCTYGVMPANGFLYVPPHSCFCYSAAMFRGLNALAAESPQSGAEVPENYAAGPLEKGPAYGSLEAETQVAEQAWLSYRHDARRTGASANVLPGSLARSWKVGLGTKLTPPVAAAGRVFVAAKDQHVVHALDAADGARRWTFAADARIDSPPSIHRGLLVFGSADGCLYCVRAADGKLAWRRRIAPAEKWLAIDGQLESVWRLHGSVLVEDGLAYCCAGRSSYLDGGLFLVAVDVATGEVEHHTRLHTNADTRVDHEGQAFVPAYHIEGAHSDILVAEGGHIYLNQFRFTPTLEAKPGKYLTKEESTRRPSMNLDGQDYVNEDIFNVMWRGERMSTYDKLAGILVDENESVGERDLGLHLFTTSGFLDTSFFNRTYWMYSQTWTGFNHANLAPKSGQLLVIGPEQTYALKAYTSRYPLSPKLDPQTKGYLLIADDNDNEPTLDPRAWGKDKGMGFSRGAPPKWYQWLPVRVTAMALAGGTLVVCGPPDVVKEGHPMAAFEGRLGSELWTISAPDGQTIAKHKLDETPIFDGLAVADDQLYLCTEQGEIVCMKGER